MTNPSIDRLHSRLRDAQLHKWWSGECLEPTEISAHWRGNAVVPSEPDRQLLLPIVGAQPHRRISPERADELSGLLNRALRESFETAILQTTLQLFSWKYSVLYRSHRTLEKRVERVERILRALPSIPQFQLLGGEAAHIQQPETLLAPEEIEALAKQLRELAVMTFAVSDIGVEYRLESDADIGGEYVAIDLTVRGVEESIFSEARRAFMQSLSGQLGSSVLSHVIISVTRRG
jgi:hypothetical protein